jgi:hypothetical protein
MNADILIHSIVQQTMVFTAQLATAGGVRVPLASLAHQVFHDLTAELRNQGLKQSVIADMFGITLRTYHRRVREMEQSRSVLGSTVWEAVLAFLKENEPVSAARVHQRFGLDDPDVVAGVLHDLVGSGLVYGSGRGKGAMFRIADQADFGPDQAASRDAARDHLVWQACYRRGPLSALELSQVTGFPSDVCETSLSRLVADAKVRVEERHGERVYASDRLDVPVGQELGWEAAVFDHFQAVVSAIANKLVNGARRSDHADVTGGSTYSLDLWRGHPLEKRVLGTLGRLRRELETLRDEVDAVNAKAERGADVRVIFYLGQDVREDERLDQSTL